MRRRSKPHTKTTRLPLFRRLSRRPGKSIPVRGTGPAAAANFLDVTQHLRRGHRRHRIRFFLLSIVGLSRSLPHRSGYSIKAARFPDRRSPIANNRRYSFLVFPYTHTHTHTRAQAVPLPLIETVRLSAEGTADTVAHTHRRPRPPPPP